MAGFPTFFSSISSQLSSHSNLDIDVSLVNEVPVRLCSIKITIPQKSGSKILSLMISGFNFVQTNFLIIYMSEEQKQKHANEILNVDFKNNPMQFILFCYRENNAIESNIWN